MHIIGCLLKVVDLPALTDEDEDEGFKWFPGGFTAALLLMSIFTLCMCTNF